LLLLSVLSAFVGVAALAGEFVHLNSAACDEVALSEIQ